MKDKPAVAYNIAYKIEAIREVVCVAEESDKDADLASTGGVCGWLEQRGFHYLNVHSEPKQEATPGISWRKTRMS